MGSKNPPWAQPNEVNVFGCGTPDDEEKKWNGDDGWTSREMKSNSSCKDIEFTRTLECVKLALK
jgi:hypothetical protein